MKMLQVLAPVVLVTLMLAAPASAEIQLAINGGFETGTFAGWTQFPQAGSQTISTTLPKDGTYSGYLETIGGPIDNIIKQANVGVGVVNPGDSVTISFDYRGTTAAGGVIFAELFSELSGGGTSKAEILGGGGPLFPNADPNVWSNFTTTTTAGPDVSGGITLQLKAGTGADNSSVANIYFDNASITIPGTAVPEPTSVALLGLGGLGMLLRRRRRS